jgi:nucleotide-binding universal stress UspA family protein
MVHSYLDVWGEYTDRGAVVGEAAEKRREALHLGLEEMLEAEAKELFSIDAQTIQTHLVTGDPAEGLLRVADDVGATLICAGTTGKSGIERLLIGSVARRLLHDSKIPLLLTHDDSR